MKEGDGSMERPGLQKRIIRNAIKCNTCGDVIESTSQHDFKSCSCGRVSVDGGLDYLRRCFKDSLNDYTELSEFEYDRLEDEKTQNEC